MKQIVGRPVLLRVTLLDTSFVKNVSAGTLLFTCYLLTQTARTTHYDLKVSKFFPHGLFTYFILLLQ